MSNEFNSFKIYSLGLVILVILFFFSWFPKMEVELIVVTEPLVMEFETNLDILAKKVSFNTNTIPAKIIKEENQNQYSEYIFIDQLKDKETNRILVFKKQDIKDLIFFRLNNIISSKTNKEEFKEGKDILELNIEDWEIQSFKKDFSTGQGKIKISLSEEVIPKYNISEIKKKIKFKDIDWVKTELEKFSEVEKVNIKSSPWFWPQTPIFLNRINIRVIPNNF